MPTTLLQLPGAESPVSINFETTETGHTVTWEDQAFQVRIEPNTPGSGTLYWNEAIRPFSYYRDGDQLHLWIQGQTYTLTLPDPRPKRAGAGAASAMASGDIKSPMPGTILKLKVNPGDTVEANQPLIIMESMKMEMTLSAPKAGWVASISCTEGQLVEMGTLLMKLEDTEA